MRNYKETSQDVHKHAIAGLAKFGPREGLNKRVGGLGEVLAGMGQTYMGLGGCRPRCEMQGCFPSVGTLPHGETYLGTASHVNTCILLNKLIHIIGGLG